MTFTVTYYLNFSLRIPIHHTRVAKDWYFYLHPLLPFEINYYVGRRVVFVEF